MKIVRLRVWPHRGFQAPRFVRGFSIWFLLSGLPGMAWAYVDPNAGGLLYQILFPLIVAIGAAWAGLRHRIGYWWARLRGRQDEPGGPAPAASASAEEPRPRTGPQGPGGHG